MSNKFLEIEKFLVKEGEPKYRAGQIFIAIFKEGIDDFDKITTISKTLRSKLKQEFSLLSLSVAGSNELGKTKKILFKLADGEKIESVLMKYKSGDKIWNSLCLSSQVGCALGCKFCATGKIGFKRNLTVDEIIDQILYFISQGIKIDNISFMGMGEPLLNPNIYEAIGVLTDKRLFGFSQRKINVSTVGIVPGIKELNKLFPEINIAFSLHTPFEDQREEMMPVSKKYPILTVMTALDDFILKNKRKVFLPYMMLAGVNDGQKHLTGLIELIKSRGKTAYLYHVNLINYNQARFVGNNFVCSSKKTINWFAAELEKARINVTVRQTFGGSINAACGQLYGEYENCSR